MLLDIDGTARYWLVKMHGARRSLAHFNNTCFVCDVIVFVVVVAGCLMVIAWMMCCTTAVLLAKYYKPMWPNDRLCRSSVWFSVSLYPLFHATPLSWHPLSLALPIFQCFFMPLLCSQVHRGIQCVTAGCTILGFILIFIHADGYSHVSTAHLLCSNFTMT